MDLLARNVMKLFEMPLDHVADRDHPRVATTGSYCWFSIERCSQCLGLAVLASR